MPPRKRAAAAVVVSFACVSVALLTRREQPESPMAKRSQNALAKLSHKCCLRCSKRLDLSSTSCRLNPAKLRSTKCTYCQRGNHRCVEVSAVASHCGRMLTQQIPEEFIPDVNLLLARHDDVFIGDEVPVASELAAIQLLQKKYTAKVEASMREAGKEGGTRKPRSAVEVGLLLHSDLKELNKTLGMMLDIQRHKVSTLALCLRVAC